MTAGGGDARLIWAGRQFGSAGLRAIPASHVAANSDIFEREDLSMDHRRLGDSGLKVSEIGLGCNNFGMRIGQDETNAVIDAAIEHGVTFLDTADVYGGQGKSEEMMGVALQGKRHQVVLATKFAMQMGSPDKQGGSRRYIMDAVEASLKR